MNVSSAPRNLSRTAEPAERLTFLELARGLAAFAVVVFHANASAPFFGGPTLPWASLGEHGVDFFFVLSGFIIVTAHFRDIGRTERAGDYVLKRVIRVLPLLWTVVLGWVALRWAVGEPTAPMLVARSLFLWPTLAPTIPLVVWTLRHEALFYAAFWVVLVRPRWGLALFAFWGGAAVVQMALVAAGDPVTGVASQFLSTYTLDFLIGAGVAWLHRHGRLPRGRWVLPAGLVLLVAAAVVEEWAGLGRTGLNDYVSPAATFWTLALGLVFAAVVVGLLAAETRRSAPRWALTLGGASYAIYLVHTPVNSVVQRALVWLPEPVLAMGGGHVVLIVAGTAMGVAVHKVYEAPLVRALRRRWLNRAQPDAVGLASPAASR